MFRVECTSCKAAYQVDERRVPAKGLMMKCPKCRASFLVSPPESLVDPATKAAPEAPPNEATAPLPDVQPKVALGPAPKASNVSLGDLPAPLQKSFELPASRGRVRNDETMIGIAPSAAQASKPGVATSAQAELPAIKKPYDAGSGLAANKATELKAPTRSPFATPGAANAPTATALPATPGTSALPKSFGKASGPITPIGIRKVSRISLPPLPPKSQPEPEIPRSEDGKEALSEAKPPSADVDLPAVAAPNPVANEAPNEASSFADDEFELPDVFGGKPKPSISQQAEPPIFGTSREALPAVKVTSRDDDLPAALATSTASLPAVSVGRPAAPASDAPLDFDHIPLGFHDDIEGGLVEPHQNNRARHVRDDEEDERAARSTGIVDLESDALETVPPSMSLDETDLPDLFGVDLPSIPPSVAAPEMGLEDAGLGFGELDLPALEGGGGEAPAASLRGQLPSFQSSEPPAVQSSAPPSFRARQDSFGDFEGLPSFGETAASVSQSMAAVSKRAADVEAHDPFEHDSFSLGSAHEKPATSERGGGEGSVSGARATAAASGGRDYGQVNLEGSSDSLNPEMDDEMEFGGIPQAESEPPKGEPLHQEPNHGASEVKPTEAPAEPVAPAAPSKPKSKRLLKIGAAAAVVVLGGAALSLEPRIGPFGAFAIGDVISRGEHQALLQRHEEAVASARLTDRYAAVVAAGAGLEQASNSARRFTSLQVATATHHLATVLRFGGPSRAQSTAQVLLSELQGQGVEPAEYATARAINTILTQGVKTAEQTLEPLPNTLLAQSVRGEYWLLVGDGKKALEVWNKAAELSRGPWTLFGIARAQFASNQLEAAIKTASLVLELEPEHAGAALLTVDALLQAGKSEHVKPETLTRIAASATAYSPREVALAHTLNGELELDFGRVGKALDEFEAALRIHPNDPRALTSSGNALLSSGRHAAALARFQAAKTAEPRSLGAALGEVRAQLALQQVDAAKPLIAALQRDHAKELEVNAVVGSVALALGEVETAKKVLTDAAAKTKDVAPEVALTPNFQRVAVEIYVSLAAAYNRAGAPEQATPILREALTQLPKSAALRSALGDVALSQGQYEKALAEYVEAQRLAPNELEPVFKAGSVLRRLKRFDEASQALDKVAQADPEYIGLPLERGLILEQSGKIALALAQYEAALAKAPGDLDVQLRVGCGRVASGDANSAREVLKDVIEKRTKSAEAAYCLGRALFTEGNSLEALRWLRQAVDLEGNNAQYHLYLGWVASDAAQIALAQKELNRALALDSGLADAYWQRGVLNLKQGAARDAMLDFKKTLELKPERYDAYADMAQALSQLGKEKDAVPYWEKAIAADSNNAVWLFRYGKLLVGRQQMAKGTELLQRAISVASKSATKPNWLWQAHYWAALGSGESSGAVKHWKEYLNLSSPDSPYRDEAKRALKRAGHAWDGN